jgi:hypothetical protein
MTVNELIEALQGFDEDLEVGFEHPSHDYWRSVLITKVEDMEEGYAQYSAYHSQLGVATEDQIEEALAMQDEDPDFPEDKRVTRMLILK